MADFKINRIRFTWKNTWTTSTSYLKDDIVRYGGKSYVCLVTHSSSANFYTDFYAVDQYNAANPVWTLWFDGYEWTGAWQASTFYQIGDIVQYGSIIYLCTNSHTSATLVPTSKTLTLSTITGTGSVATASFIDQGLAPYKVGGTVTVAGVSLVGFNGTFVVASSSNTNVTYSSSVVSAPGGAFALTTDFDSNNSHGLGQVVYGTDNTGTYYGLVISSPSATLLNVLNTQPIGSTFTATITSRNKSTGVSATLAYTFTKRAAIQSYAISGGTGYLIPTDLIVSPENWNTIADFAGSAYTVNAEYVSVTFTPVTPVTTATVAGLAQSGLEANQSSWASYAVGDDWVKDWTVSTRFRKNDIVRYGATIYRCNNGHTSSTTITLGLESDQSKWDAVTYSSDWKTDWTVNTRYKIGDVARYGGIVYKCITSHTSPATLVATSSVDQNSSATALALGANRVPESAAWTFASGTINLQSSGLPYHSYGNPAAVYAPYAQNYNRTWSLRGGTNVAAGSAVSRGTSVIGYWLNGVAIFSPSSNNTPTGKTSYLPNWHYNISYQAEQSYGYTFGEDLSGGIAESNGQYHYVDFSFQDNWLTGSGHVNGSTTATGIADASLIPYIDSTLTFPDGHSKIVGWALDGYPIYGPYGYGTAMSSGSIVRRMTNGYSINGSRTTNGTTPPVNATYPLGMFVEDYSYVGGQDLDSKNGRYCVTPDYPNGTYAYFTAVGPTLTPAYPYVVGNTFYGDATTVTNGGGIAISPLLGSSLGLETDQGKWTTVHSGLENRGVWNNYTRYKLNDVVRYGPDLYICTTYHTSTNVIDTGSFTIYVPGMEYANTWSITESYALGDVVTYGGYQYVSKSTNNIGQTPSTSSASWDLLQTNYNIRGDWSVSTSYLVGDTVRRSGYLYVCIQDNIGQETTKTAYWTLVVPGMQWKGPWVTGTTYLPGDVATFYTTAYSCLIKHAAGSTTTPYLNPTASLLSITSVSGTGLAVTFSFTPQTLTPFPVGTSITIASSNPSSYNGTYEVITASVSQVIVTSTNVDAYVSSATIRTSNHWTKYSQGDNWLTLQNAGDLQVYNNGANTPLAVGANGTTLKVDRSTSLPAVYWGNFGAIPGVYYVSTNGTDAPGYGLSLNAPYATVKYACANITGPASIFIKTGLYSEQLPISIPAGVALVGDELRGTTIQPYATINQTATASYKTVTGTITNVITPNQIYISTSGSVADLAVGAQIVITGGALVTSNLPAGTYYITAISTIAGNYITVSATAGGATITNLITNATPTGMSFSAGNNSIAVTTTANMRNGTPVRFTSASIVVATLSTSSTSGVVTISSNAGIQPGQSIVFFGTAIGNLFAGITYYVREVLSGITITLSTTSDILNVMTQVDATGAMTANIGNFAGLYSDRLYYVIGSTLTPTQFSVSATLGSITPVTLTNTTLQSQAVYGGDVLSNMFYVRNACGIRNMTLRGLNGALTQQNLYATRRPLAGAYVSLDPGTGTSDSTVQISSKSPYIQNVTTFGFGCTGLKIDGTLHGSGNKSIVSNDFTQVISDGIGIWCTGPGALTEAVSVFSYYAHIGYLAENGGRIRATNGNTSYGSYGCVAEGFDPTETALTATINNRNQGAQVASVFIGEATNKILALEYSNAGQAYTSASYTFNGAGQYAVAVGDEYRDGGVYEVRILGTDFGAGGAGYNSISNNAQLGDKTTIVIAASDINSLSVYRGMRVLITSGTGVGQYGYVVTYDNGATKTIAVAKESFSPITATTVTTTTATTTGSYIFDNTLVVGTLASGTLSVGQIISGSNVIAGTYITANLGGTGSSSTWTVSNSHTPVNTTVIVSGGTVVNIAGTISGTTLTVTANNGTLLANMVLVGGTVTAGTYIVSNLTGTATSASSSWTVSTSQTATGITTANEKSVVLQDTTGVAAGQLITGSGITGGTTVSAVNLITKTVTLTSIFTQTATGIYSFYAAPTAINAALNSITTNLQTSLYADQPIQFIPIEQTTTTVSTSHSTANLSASSINGTGVLTVGTVSGTIEVGMCLTGGSIVNGTTFITGNISGAGAGSQWQTNTTTVQASATITATKDTITLQSTASMWVGQQIVFSGSIIYGGLSGNQTYYITNILGNGVTVSLAAAGANQTVVSVLSAVMTAKTTGIYGGLSTGTTYYVMQANLTSTSFTVTVTPSGTVPVTLTAYSGTGTMQIIEMGWNNIVSGTPAAVSLDSTTVYSIESRVQFTTPTASSISSGIVAPSGSWIGSAFGAGTYVAVDSGASGGIYRSATGNSWISSSGFPAIAYSAVTYGALGFLAVSSASYTAAVSTDGVSWSSTSMVNTATSWSGCTYGNSTYFAVASNTNIATKSTDLVTWPQLTLPAVANWTDIAYGNAGYQAITANGVLVAISSGATYTSVSPSNVTTTGSIASTTGTIGAVTGAGTSISPWVATITGVSATTGIVNGSPIRATNGSGNLFGGTPTSCTVQSFVAGTSITFAVVGGSTPIAGTITNIIVSGSGAVYTVTRTGTTYSLLHSSPGANYTVGDKLTILGTSLGGTTPTNDISIRVLVVSTGAISTISFTGTATAPTCASSIDMGSSWTASTLPAHSAAWGKIVYGNGRFVVVGKNTNKSAYSFDGITWYTGNLPQSGNWNAVAYGAGQFVAVGGTGTLVASSPNGLDWKVVSVAGSANRTTVSWGNLSNTAGWIIASDSNISNYVITGTQAVGRVAIASGKVGTVKIWEPGSNYQINNYVTSFAGQIANTTLSVTGVNEGSILPLPLQIGQTIYGSTGLISPTITQVNTVSFTGSISNYTLYVLSQPVTPLTVGLVLTGTNISSGTILTSISSVSFTGTVGGAGLTTLTYNSGTIPTVGMMVSGTGITTGTYIASGTSPTFTLSQAATIGSKSVTGTLYTINQFQTVSSTLVTGTSYTINTSLTVSQTNMQAVSLGSSAVNIIDPSITTPMYSTVRVGLGVLGQPSFANRGTGYRTSTTTVTISGTGYADIFQSGKYLSVTGLASTPTPGAALNISGDPIQYRVVVITNLGSTKYYFQISPALTILKAPSHGLGVTVRQKYSQCRITGHDFLLIGTGNAATTNYPYTDVSTALNYRQITESAGGRVFQTSTDQDGNFLVGNLFGVQQASGIVTISADQFSLQGLQSLTIGGLSVGPNAIVIEQFSTDSYFTANSDKIIPTQRAIKTYLARNVAGGGAAATAGQVTAGVVGVGGPNRIFSPTLSTINVPRTVNFTQGKAGGIGAAGSTGGINGTMLAATFFNSSFSGGANSDK